MFQKRRNILGKCFLRFKKRERQKRKKDPKKGKKEAWNKERKKRNLQRKKNISPGIPIVKWGWLGIEA